MKDSLFMAMVTVFMVAVLTLLARLAFLDVRAYHECQENCFPATVRLNTLSGFCGCSDGRSNP